jgi:iron complex outermembrane receptor protein
VLYNYTTKATDLDYVRLHGDVTDSLNIENTVYTYAYWNHTFSPNNQTQDEQDITNAMSGAPCGSTLATECFQSPGTKIPSGPFAGTYATDVLSYNKENYYRVYGDILRVNQDYDFGWVSGQIRTGVWWENSATHRFKYYFDANVCTAQGISPFGGPAAAALCGAKKGSGFNPPYGYAKDNEYSDWSQYEPFVEVDIKPIDNLTLTPGFKYVDWNRGVDAPVAQGSNCGVALACPPFNNLGQNYRVKTTTTRDLPFFEANYKIEPSWSVYAQYAQGIYVPDISTFEQNPPTTQFPAPETTTNYQFGTVYYADNFTFDADVYYIGIKNNYIPVLCSVAMPGGSPNDTCYLDNGRAIYKGLEGEGTYAFDEMFDVDLHGLSVFMNGALMSSRESKEINPGGLQPGLWEPNAPQYTAAAGLLYQQHGWKFGLIEKLVGQQFSDAANLSQYRLAPYGNLSAALGYNFGVFEFDLNFDNLLDSQKTTAIVENGFAADGNPHTWKNSLDQYFFQSTRSVFGTMKVHL